MDQAQLTNIFLDQSKDLFWTINLDFQLIYANKTYHNFIKEVTGAEKKLNDSALVESFGKEDREKWKAYYNRAFKGTYFEVEENFYDPKSKEVQHNQVTFEPLIGEDQKIFAVTCQSKNITRIVKQRFEASQLMDTSLDVFCSINKQGDFVYLSAAAEKLWGYTAEELIGKPYIDLILEEDFIKFSEIAAAILCGQNIKSFVNRFKKKNGGIACNLWSARWDKTSQLMHCVVKNANEIIEQEENLQQSEQRFKALVQEGADMVAIIDSAANYKYASPSGLSILGIPQEEFIGKNAYDFIHPDDADKALEGLQKLTTQHRVVLDPYRFKNHEGEWRWLETVMTNMLDNPVVNGIVANSRDITDKIEEKQRLKLLESVILNTKDAVLITEAEPFDEPGPKIIYVNEAFTKMTGYEAEEVIGKTPRILQGPKSNKQELAKLGQALKKWKSYEMTTVNYKKTGEEFWIHFRVTPVVNENGRYTHWIAIERDVTEQKVKELERNLVNEIDEIFNQSDDKDLTRCLQDICKHITKFGDFDFAELWLPAMDLKTINRAANYSIGKAGTLFYKTAINHKSFSLGEGMPGYIWETKGIKIWEDVDDEWSLFKRKAAAKKAGIKAVMGVPLKDNDAIVGVLLVGTKKTKSALALYSALMQKLEVAVGKDLSRKKIEVELAQIFEFTPDLICVADFNGYIKRINPAGLKLLGYSIEEMCSRPINSFVYEQDRMRASEKRTELYKGVSIRNFEHRYLTKEGNIVWLSWSATSAPEHGIVYSVAKNITEEKKLRELNKQASRLAKIGSWEVDLLNQNLFWSEKTHEMHGTDPISFQPNLLEAINFYRADFRPMVKNTIEKCISSGQPFDFEAVLVTTEKKELWVRANGIAEIVDGECLRMYGSVQDIDDRKEAEVRLQSLAGNLPAVVFQYLKSPDDTDALKNVSNGSYPIWGISPEEAYQNNQPVWDGIRDGGDFEKVQKSISDSIEMKTKWMCRYKYVMPSGELRTHLVSGTPAFLADGSVTFNSIILDVTQETKNEELLEQTSKIARVGSWELDLINQDGDRMYWSPMLFEIVEVEDNYNPTLTGGIEFHIGESKERIKNALDLLITDGTEFDEEILLLTAKGNERWIRAIGKSEMANNKRTKIYGSYQDIHERKKAEKKILKANERFEKVIDATNDSIWDWDLENDTKHRPQFVERFFEKKASKLTPINSCGPNNFHLEDFEKVQDSVQKAINDPACNRWELQYRVLNEKGVIHYVNDRGLIMRNSEGTAVRMIGAMSDISDIKRMTIELSELNQSLQQYTLELERSNEELEQFAFVASHDLQEPLRMISSFMDLLQRKYGDQLDDKGLQYIHFATDGARRMKQIILDLLEYSKAGSPLEEEEEVDVNEMLTEFRQSRRKMIAEKVASIKSSKLPNLNTYRAAMVQIFHCLLDNALKYTEEDTAPVIEVEAVENEREWEFSIKDNGIGIDPQFHDKIFVIFQRLHNNETYAGTGIGLSIAKKHVEFLNGRIWLESAPGKGTTFYFTIPKIN